MFEPSNSNIKSYNISVTTEENISHLLAIKQGYNSQKGLKKKRVTKRNTILLNKNPPLNGSVLVVI
jgi:hypothetical protein